MTHLAVSDEFSHRATPPLTFVAPNPGLTTAFWHGVIGGLHALTHRDVWIAATQLTRVIDHTVAQLLPQSDHGDVTRWGYRLQEIAPLRYVDVAPHLWRAYGSLITDVVAFLEQNQRFTEADREYHQQCQAITDIGTRTATPDFSEVISWRTCSIVLPAYNEEEVIADTVRDCIRAVRRFCPNSEFIIVDDGSRDKTGLIVDTLAAHDASVVAIHNRPNKGYGGALLAGFAAARGELLFFMDSDGQFDINDIARLLTISEEQPTAAVLGYRAKRSDPFMRKLNAWGWKLATRTLIGLQGIRDIDCAFKLFPSRYIRACGMIAQGASVNAEFLRKFQLMQVPIYQLPVQHLPRTKGSPTGAKLSVIKRAFGELFQLRPHLRNWRPGAEVRN